MHGVKYNHYVIIVGLSAPTDVSIGIVTSNSIEVTWDQLLDATSYHISCIIAPSHDGNKNKTVKGGATTRCTITGLTENTSYLITVQWCDRHGKKSDPSAPKQITTGKWFITTIILYHIDG